MRRYRVYLIYSRLDAETCKNTNSMYRYLHIGDIEWQGLWAKWYRTGLAFHMTETQRDEIDICLWLQHGWIFYLLADWYNRQWQHYMGPLPLINDFIYNARFEWLRWSVLSQQYIEQPISDDRRLPLSYHSDVIMYAMASQIAAARLFTQPFVSSIDWICH